MTMENPFSRKILYTMMIKDRKSKKESLRRLDLMPNNKVYMHNLAEVHGSKTMIHGTAKLLLMLSKALLQHLNKKIRKITISILKEPSLVNMIFITLLINLLCEIKIYNNIFI